MTGRERTISAALAAVVVVGIIDATAGHDSASKPSSTGTPTATSQPTTAAPTPTPTSPPTSGRRSPRPRHSAHRGGGGATTAATAASAAPTPTSTTRARHTSSTSSATPSVSPGVLGTFSYTTTGSEQTNIPGTHRTFPSTTQITNKRKSCGVASTWKPVPEHAQTQVLCPAGGGIKVTSYRTTISFYGVSSGENFKCSGPSYVYQPGVAAGHVWKFKCKSPDAVAVQKSRVIGYDEIGVGGTRVRTLHVHVNTKLRGNSSGTSTQDYWIATSKPILVKEQGTVAATQQNVNYSETYSLALKSLSPNA